MRKFIRVVGVCAYEVVFGIGAVVTFILLYTALLDVYHAIFGD
jgi:hypothetical protein